MSATPQPKIPLTLKMPIPADMSFDTLAQYWA
jgi:hypothetical protein